MKGTMPMRRRYVLRPPIPVPPVHPSKSVWIRSTVERPVETVCPFVIRLAIQRRTCVRRDNVSRSVIRPAHAEIMSATRKPGIASGFAGVAAPAVGGARSAGADAASHGHSLAVHRHVDRDSSAEIVAVFPVAATTRRSVPLVRGARFAVLRPAIAVSMMKAMGVRQDLSEVVSSVWSVPVKERSSISIEALEQASNEQRQEDCVADSLLR